MEDNIQAKINDLLGLHLGMTKQEWFDSDEYKRLKKDGELSWELIQDCGNVVAFIKDNKDLDELISKKAEAINSIQFCEKLHHVGEIIIPNVKKIAQETFRKLFKPNS